MSENYYPIKNKGFTLIEVIVSLFVVSVLLSVVVYSVFNIFKNPPREMASMNNIDQARLISTNFANELRNSVMGNDGGNPLSEASDFEIIFYSNFNSAAPAVNRFRYFTTNDPACRSVASAGQYLCKGVTVPTGSPLTYDSNAETVTQILSGLKNDDTPAFYYYDGNYDGNTDSLLTPANVNNVNFARINLVVPAQLQGNGTGSFSVTAGVTIRVLKNNYGS